MHPDLHCAYAGSGRDPAKLDASVGRQDHTALPSAAPVYAKGFAGLKCQSAEALAKAEARFV
jgi:hypothetical protein